MDISFNNTRALRLARNLRTSAVHHYRHHYRFLFNFSAILAVIVVPSLLLTIISHNDAAALLALESNAPRNLSALPTAAVAHLVPTERYESPRATRPGPQQQWDEAEAMRSIVTLDADALEIDAFEVHELALGEDTPILYFDGRPIRPARTLTMEVTAYSPDARSCAPFADGITASGYSVWTNGMKLIASDKRFKFGTLMSVPGYNGNKPTPVLDRGGAIKGNKLDVLFPTHRIARQWGRQKLTVTIWEYVDTATNSQSSTAAATIPAASSTAG